MNKSWLVTILVAMVATLALIIGGLVWGPESVGDKILMAGGPMMTILLAMLKSEWDKKDLTKVVEAKTYAAAQEVKDELKITADKRAEDNAVRDGKLDRIVEQTNGSLTEKLVNIESKVDQLNDSKQFPTPK